MIPTDCDRPWPPTSVYGYPRSAGGYAAALASLQLGASPRYLPRDGQTFCATAIWDGSFAMGVFTPGRFYGGNAGVGVAIGGGCNSIQANDLGDWFGGPDGRAWGWAEVQSLELATAAAAQGHPTLFTWHNAQGHGHTGWIEPAGTIAQAGARCGQGFSFQDVFGAVVPTLRFFTHP